MPHDPIIAERREKPDLDFGPKTVPVSGIWLRTTLDDKGNKSLEVLAEVDEEFRVVITELADGIISHIVEPSGILNSPRDE